MIPKSVRPERIAEWREEALLGGWALGPGHMAALAGLDDGTKFCWDPSPVL